MAISDTALPNAAWFAEHIMGWKLCSRPQWVLEWWCDARGKQCASQMWNPRTKFSDARQMLKQINKPWSLQYDLREEPHWRYRCEIYLRVVEYAETLEEAICRTVYAWWEAQQGQPL